MGQRDSRIVANRMLERQRGASNFAPTKEQKEKEFPPFPKFHELNRIDVRIFRGRIRSVERKIYLTSGRVRSVFRLRSQR